ncbi:hypothetical protein [Massilia sp.]|uniref:hypothetical protein n=1 Tax=Massilia sp. TaxID=1882437 RepID=UPI0028980A61|nr:hypothetical protein [Massilia sp.]
MTANRTAANRRLAELLGWTELFEVPGAILGAPPAGQPAGRGQAKVPDWTGDWRDCGPLLAQHRMSLDGTALDAVARCRPYEAPVGTAAYAEFETEDAAVRAAIVAAVVAKLEARQ